MEEFCATGSIVSNFYDVDSSRAYNATLKVFKGHNYKLSSEYPQQNEINPNYARGI